MNISEKIAAELGLPQKNVDEAVALIDDGNTIPFISRYRKEVTGGMTDVQLRALDERLTYLRNLETRKEEVRQAIEEQGKMTPELSALLEEADILQRVEDLYKPFKKKKSTRAEKARALGLAPLAEIIREQALTEGEPVDSAMPYAKPEEELTAEDALAGACDIIAEEIADDPDMVQMVRDFTRETGSIVTEAVDEKEKTPYEMYYEYSEPVAKIPDHRVLAVNRGGREKKLKVTLAADTDTIIERILEKLPFREESIFSELIRRTAADAYRRLMAPSVERELRSELTERAEKSAVSVFAENTKNLLMAPPVKDAKVLAIDPGQRTGCKVAALGKTGKLLAYATIYPTPPRRDIAGSEKIITQLIDRFGLNTVVIGNGTASRETEQFIADYIEKTGRDLRYTIVSEAGASVYSASKLASEEYPDLDVTTRGAMSIGRRLQDPMAELVKIPPRSIGVGQYQHDINQTLLDEALTGVVEDCVNRVGVDVNTASPSLLSYISGINSLTAKNIVAYREEHGAFTSRDQLHSVPRLGEKTYAQCAGFLRIHNGTNPLDATAVHPESYEKTEMMLSRLGIDSGQIAAGGAGDIGDRICEMYPVQTKRAEKKSPKKRTLPDNGFAALAVLLEDESFTGKKKSKKKGKSAEKEQKTRLRQSIRLMADDLGIGEMTLSDIVEEIRRPGRDPREEMPPVIFRRDVLSFEDLAPGMELMGTVRNVVDFGAFVDIGVKTDGLVHVSELSDRFIKNPREAVSVGDTVKVWILEVDQERKRISLTMKRNRS